MEILYEDKDIITAVKPAGIESQSRRSFEPDMVSELKRHIHKLSPAGGEPYVGVIHRLDKPVGGVMVYAKTKTSAAALSKMIQEGKLKKHYLAVLCGKPVDNVGKYVDFLLKEEKANTSRIVDKGITGAKRAELNYRVLGILEESNVQSAAGIFSLVDVELLTGRHHQIRVQFAGHGTPIYGDGRYGEFFAAGNRGTGAGRQCGFSGQFTRELALFSYSLTFPHPVSGKTMCCTAKPQGGAFAWFADVLSE